MYLLLSVREGNPDAGIEKEKKEREREKKSVTPC